MKPNLTVLKVAARFQIADVRKDVRDSVQSINKTKGMSRETLNDYVYTDDSKDDTVSPARKDKRPEDIFSPKPRNMNVSDYARKGWPGTADDYVDMQKALRKQIPKDKGYDNVSQLSQYLVETNGGGGHKPVGK